MSAVDSLLKPAHSPTDKPPVGHDVVEALRDLLEVLASLILEFRAKADRSRLLDAMQLVIDVALEHDQCGNYGVFEHLDAPEIPAEGGRA